ncbi:MAG: hypothetical protein IME99_09270 [Proteobacteria bacterium]|nr:hypothetical protein [Pseudomonadota bacterium]
MTFAPLLAGLGSFFVALFIHSLVWRIRRPKRDVLTLFILFCLLAALPVVLLLFCPYTPLFSGVERESSAAIEVCAALLSYGSLAASYIMTYPALQARCPSLRMVLHIERAGGRGMSLAEVSALFDSADLITDRLEDLLTSGLVVSDAGPVYGNGQKNEGPFKVTRRGALVLKPFMLFRTFLGLAPGAG